MDKLKFKLEALKTIDKMFDKAEKLEQKKDDLSDNLKESYDKQIIALNNKKTELKSQLEDIQESTDKNWEEVKETFSESMKHYKAGFKELGKLFK